MLSSGKYGKLRSPFRSKTGFHTKIPEDEEIWRTSIIFLHLHIVIVEENVTSKNFLLSYEFGVKELDWTSNSGTEEVVT